MTPKTNPQSEQIRISPAARQHLLALLAEARANGHTETSIKQIASQAILSQPLPNGSTPTTGESDRLSAWQAWEKLAQRARAQGYADLVEEHQPKPSASRKSLEARTARLRHDLIAHKNFLAE